MLPVPEQYDYIIAIPVYFYNVTSYYIHLYYRKTYCEGKGAAFGWGITYLLTPMFLLSHAISRALYSTYSNSS